MLFLPTLFHARYRVKENSQLQATYVCRLVNAEVVYFSKWKHINRCRDWTETLRGSECERNRRRIEGRKTTKGEQTQDGEMSVRLPWHERWWGCRSSRSTSCAATLYAGWGRRLEKETHQATCLSPSKTDICVYSPQALIQNNFQVSNSQPCVLERHCM